MVEHSEWVMRRFRATSLYTDYAGDSVLNAVADYLWMLGGFLVAWRLRTIWIAVLVVALDLASALVARDSLALSTLMVIAPVDALGDWQQEANPNPVGDGRAGPSGSAPSTPRR